MKNKRKKKSFKTSDVQFQGNFPQFILNAKAIKTNFIFMNLLRPFLLYFMDFLAKPQFALSKIFGRPILRLIGIGLPKHDVIRVKEVLLLKHDGAKEATDIFLPKHVFKNKSKAPTILVRLPYWKNILRLAGYLLASKGYVTVLQDIRGCANSSEHGTLAITFYLRSDGMETLKWITERFWYDGKIGMWGVSFLGMTELAVAWDNKGLLTCINLIECAYSSVLNHPGGLNLLGMGITVWALLGMITRKNPDAREMLKEGYEDIFKLYRNPLLSMYNDPLDPKRYLLKLSELAKIRDPEILTNLLNENYGVNFKFNERDSSGNLITFLKKAIVGRTLETDYEYLPYGFGFTGEHFNTPILWVSNWYDMFFEQCLLDLKKIEDKSPEFAKKNLKMVIGPGAHFGLDFVTLNLPHITLYEIVTNMKKALALFQTFFQFWFYERFLIDDGKDMSKVPPFRIYIMNKKIWRYFAKWPPKTHGTKFFLHSGGNANSRFGDGNLTESEPGEEPHDEFEFDPTDPVVTRGGRFLALRSGEVNQAQLEKREDILVYTTKKLKEGIEIIGEVKLVLHASSSAKDTDFMVKLVDVYSDRKAINLVDSGVRARFRESLENPSFIEPDKIYKYEIYVGSTGIYFPKGHRIRIEVSSSNFPKFDVNSNLAGEQSEEGYKIAHQKIFHDADHPSCVILPVFKPKK